MNVPLEVDHVAHVVSDAVQAYLMLPIEALRDIKVTRWIDRSYIGMRAYGLNLSRIIVVSDASRTQREVCLNSKQVLKRIA